MRIYLNLKWAVILLAASLSASLFTDTLSAQTTIPIDGSNGEWHVENADRAADIRFADIAGRRAMWLRNNTQVIRTRSDFTDGTIEFDIAPTENGNFVGLLFRRESATSHENIYFRIHRSGTFNALQYSPRINGSSTWQLYPEFNATIDLPRLTWTRVRVEVSGSRLDVFVNNGERPALSVPRLRGVPGKGSVAFWGRVNDRPTEWAAGLSNIAIRPRNTPAATSPPVSPTDATLLTDWEAADGGPAQADIKWDAQVSREWKRAPVEEKGLINLNRLFVANRGRRTAFAKTSVESDGERTVRLDVGYSDDVTVFLNGSPVFSGNNTFESRHPQFMGFVQPEFESIYLNLKKGRNDLVLAVTDGQVFGWGFIARLRR